MPKIPDFTALGPRPSPQAGTSVASYRPTSGAETAPALAIAQVGNQLEHEGEKNYRLAKFKQDEINTVRTEDAFNQVRTKALELARAEGTGFVHQKGSAVASRPGFLKDYNDLLDEAAKTIAAGLDNDEQRQKFKPRADNAVYQFNLDLLNHITKETDAYAVQVFKGTIDTEIQQATARWQAPNAVAQSLERIRAAVNREANRMGAAPEARTATLNDSVSKVHASVIMQAIAANDYKYAQQWYDLNKDQIDKTTAVMVGKAIHDGSQKELFNNYQRQFIDGGRDLGNLQELERAVANDGGLDETRKNALLGRIDSRRVELNNQARETANRVERQMERAINQINTNTLQGFEPTMEQMAPLINAAAGTPLEGQVVQMLNVANETARFRRMPPIAQEAYLTQLEAAVRKEPNKFDVGMVPRFKEIHKAQKEQALDNPVGFAVRQGFVDPATPGAQPLDLSKPEKLGDLLAARFELARSVARYYNVPLKPLQPEDVALLQNAVRQMAPEEKSAYFGALAKSAGADLEGYRAMMNQVSPDDPVTAAGGMAAMRGLTTTQGRTTADIIFRGQGYLNPSKKEDGKPSRPQVTMPTGDELNRMMTQFNDAVGDAFEGKPAVRNVFVQTAQTIYAERIAGKNESGILDTSIWKQSIDLAIGGEPLRYNGRTILPPPGWEPASFKDGVKERIDALAAAERLPPGMTAAQVRALPLENAGDGVYAIRSGDSVLKHGNATLLIDLNKPASVIVGPTKPINGRKQGSAADRASDRLTLASVVGQPRAEADRHRDNLRQLTTELSRATTDKQRAVLHAEIAAEQIMLAERDERAVRR